MIAYLSQIVERTSNKIIHANDVILVTLCEKVDAKVRSDETCASGYNDGFWHNEMNERERRDGRDIFT